MQKTQTVGSPFFGVFSSDCIPKITKNANVHFFHNFRESSLMQIFL